MTTNRDKPPLADIRVLDASRVLAGPFCGQVLGDLGADVLKIERVGVGDETRSWGPPFQGDFSAYFLSCNRNKRGIALDLTQPDGRRLFHELVKQSDVLLENFRPASAQKLGLGIDELHSHNPRLVICSISGFGRSGPMKDLPGYDFAIQGLSGLMSITGPVEGPPSKVGVAVTDVLTGLYASIAVLSCLHARRLSGHGYSIDLALLDCALAAQVNVAQAFLSSGKVPARQGNAHLQIVPYQLFETSDGWIILAIGNDKQFRRYCEFVGRQDLADDPRFATNAKRVEHRTALIPDIKELMRTKSTSMWERLFQQHDIPHAPVRGYGDLFRHPQIDARNMRITVRDTQGNPVDLVGSPFHVDGASLPQPTMPPALGQDTDDVLGEMLGLGREQLDDLRQRGVIG